MATCNRGSDGAPYRIDGRLVDAVSELPPAESAKGILGLNEETFALLSRILPGRDRPFRIVAPNGTHQIILTEPTDLRYVFRDNYRNFEKGRSFRNMKLLMGNGLIVQDGDFWLQQRRMLQPLFHERVLLQIAACMRSETLRLLAKWTENALAGSAVDVAHDVSRSSLEALLSALFGDDLAALTTADGKGAFDILTDEPARDLRFVGRFRELLELVVGLVEERVKTERMPPDLLSMLIAARDGYGQPMPLSQLRDEVATFIIAGHETTAALLTWLWILLARHPDVEAKVEAEAKASRLGAAAPATLPNLPFVKQTIFETLRLYPPVWLEDRRVIDDDEIGGFSAPAGSEVFLPLYFVHRNPRFFESPDVFQPARFTTYPLEPRYQLPNENARAPSVGESAFFPFSTGPRRCIGDQFALTLAQIHLGVLVPRLRLTRDDAPVELETLVNLRPKGRVEMWPTVR
jgi:cytochrome P450